MSGVLCQQRGLLRKGVVGLERLPDHRHWVAAVGERPVGSVLVDDAPTLPLLQIEPLCDAPPGQAPGAGGDDGVVACDALSSRHLPIVTDRPRESDM